MYGYESYKKGYLRGADGNYHKVSDEIWFEYMRSIWREMAVEKRDRGSAGGKKAAASDGGRCPLPRLTSFDSLLEAHGEQFLPKHRSAEDEAMGQGARKDIHARLCKAINALNPGQQFLICKLYLEGGGMSIRDFSAAYGQPRTSVQYRHRKTLEALKGFIENEKGFSKDLLREALGYEEI